MSFVDDSLMGTSPARSTKSGAKSAAFASLDGGEKNAAFESAIADAGKKKPAVVSLSGKDASSVSDEARGKVDIGKTDKDGRIPTTVDQSTMLRSRGSTTSLPLQNLALIKEKAVGSSQQEKATGMPLLNRPISTKDTVGDPSHTGMKTVDAAIEATPTTLADVGDILLASETERLPSLGEIADLVKDGKLVKFADSSKPAGVDSRKTQDNKDDEAAVEADEVETGGVSQLLALLGSPNEVPAAASAEVQTTPTELISEFQALADRAGADRAGKARSDNRQTTGADTQHQAGLLADANAVANATASGTDRTFRFARADGKGQSVSMSINKDGDTPSARIDASGTKADAASNAKAETVTVLDSRRYLGIAANTNSQAVAAAVTGSTEWARAMQPSSGLSSPEAASAAGKVVNTLKIQMHPIDLGMVTATLRLKDDELHVDLKVESGEAFRQLSDDQNAMVKALRSQGFAVDQINITFNAPSDASSGNSGSQQPQAQAGQQGRDASGDGAAQGRSRNNDSSQQQSGERWMGNGATDEVSAASESGRTDHTYM